MGELAIFAENCGGQNKNPIVVCFIIWHIETEFFPKVTLNFYVWGHKNNSACHPFNILKGGYHNKNIYSFQ